MNTINHRSNKTIENTFNVSTMHKAPGFLGRANLDRLGSHRMSFSVAMVHKLPRKYGIPSPLPKMRTSVDKTGLSCQERMTKRSVTLPDGFIVDNNAKIP